MTFEQWMKKVDNILVSKSGMSSMDLADNAYHDMYDDGDTPGKAADDTLRSEGYCLDEY